MPRSIAPWPGEAPLAGILATLLAAQGALIVALLQPAVTGRKAREQQNPVAPQFDFALGL